MPSRAEATINAGARGVSGGIRAMEVSASREHSRTIARMDEAGNAPEEFEAWPAPVEEDGSAPPILTEMRARPVRVWPEIKCGRCLELQESVWPEPDGSAPTSLSVVGGLIVEVSGGYGMVIDPSPVRERETHPFVLCGSCVEWARNEIPGLDLVLRRLSQW